MNVELWNTYLFRIYHRSLLGLHPGVDAKLHRQNSGVELRHRQPEVCHDPRLPVLRKSLFDQHSRQIINPTTENRKHSRRVRTPKHVVEKTLRVLLVLDPRRRPPLAQRPAQVRLREQSASIGRPASSTIEKVSDKIQIRLSLIGHEG